MNSFHFEDEASVIRQAEKVVSKILSDKSYINPEKLGLLISDYEKKQIKLDSQLSKSIKTQIECIKQSKQSVQEANQSMKEANAKTQCMAEIWNQQAEFHDFMDDVLTLSQFQANVAKVVEQLTYFIDMDQEMQKLEKLAQDQSKYMLVSSKLLNLIELRNYLLEDTAWQRQTAIMRKEFIKVDNFETNFYDKIFQNFTDCIKISKENPQGLKNCVKVIQAYDKLLEQKGKQKIMRSRAVEAIKSSIDNKFEQNLVGSDELIEVIQNAKFTTTDLIDVSDYVQPCFPKQFPILLIFQEQYQLNIEKLILPYFDQIEEEKQYGHLVILLGWIDDYETMLARAGLDSNNLINLKSKVKIMMPFFIDHNRKIVEDYIAGCLEEDKKKFNRKFYEQTLRDGSDLVSLFPSDIFRFINQEAELIKDQLKGEIFIEFVRCITEALNYFQKDLTQQILEEFQVIKMVDSEIKIVDFQYKCILFINNYNECLKHAGESKEIYAQYVSEDYKTRIEKIFMNEVQKQFNQSVPKFIGIVVRIIYLKCIQELFPSLFTSKWLNDKSGQAMSTILKTIATQLKDLDEQNLIINVVHYRMLVKEVLQFLVDAYIEQLILSIKIIYKATANMEIKYCSEPYTHKKIQSETDPKNVFNSKVAFSQAMKKDKQSFFKFAENFSQCTPKAFMTKLQAKLTLVTDLFLKKKNQIESLLAKVAQTIPEKASELVEAILIVREDVESRAAFIPKKGMGVEN